MRNGVWQIDGSNADATQGRVIWSPVKSIWNTLMYAGAIVLGPLYFSWPAFVFFIVFTYLSLLMGHSLGMHRRSIHRSFECSKTFERFLVWLGVLVGMAGPFGILKIHDLRDWAQREPECHEFFAHRRGLLMDAFWQLHCTFEFVKPPQFSVEADFSNDRFYQFLEKTWYLQQMLFGLGLYVFGGMPWLVWGMFVRVAVSVTSHWVVTYYAHNTGPGDWLVPGAAVQASNLPHVAFLTHGECWHNNHHAFPESARMGIEPGQLDTGWLVLKLLERLGIVWSIGTPREPALREDLSYKPNL